MLLFVEIWCTLFYFVAFHFFTLMTVTKKAIFALNAQISSEYYLPSNPTECFSPCYCKKHQKNGISICVGRAIGSFSLVDSLSLSSLPIGILLFILLVRNSLAALNIPTTSTISYALVELIFPVLSHSHTVLNDEKLKPKVRLMYTLISVYPSITAWTLKCYIPLFFLSGAKRSEATPITTTTTKR